RMSDRGAQRLTPPPQRVAEHDDALLARLRFVGAIEAAEGWHDVEDVEELSHRARDRHAARIADLRAPADTASARAGGVELVAARHEVERLARPDTHVHE